MGKNVIKRTPVIPTNFLSRQKCCDDEHQSLSLCHSVTLPVTHSVSVNGLAGSARRENWHQSGSVGSGSHYFRGITAAEMVGLLANRLRQINVEL